MPTINYNGQSFSIDGRRLWILGASIQYARVPHALWASRIAAAKQAGFNTIETACPWVLHEPRKGRVTFEGQANVRQFVQLCGQMGMRVILRPGPYIGIGFDGGGLPGWLIETPEIRLRENNPAFLEHVSRYFRKLLGEVSDLQVNVGNGGAIILVQSEHAWTCSNEDEAATYLNEITRFIRESGITVPIINANDLWQDTPGSIDTWRGYFDLLPHLRQLRTVQANAPRLVSEFEAADVQNWGGSGEATKKRTQEGTLKSPQRVLRHLAEVLAGGAQPVVSPFHAGTNFGFLGGRQPGDEGGFITTAGAIDPPLGQAGTRGEKYHAIRRLVTFANHFGHVFAELDPEYQPIVLDPEQGERKASEKVSASASRNGLAIVPLRGTQGRIVFVFGDVERGAGATLVLDDGLSLPVNLGDQSVGWYALDVDLQGVGRLDYANICPWAMVDRSIVVFQGPAKSHAFISIGGTPLDATIPADDKPLVMEHKGLTIVICNQEQIDATFHDDHAVYVGTCGFDADGHALPDDRFARTHIIRRHGKIETVDLRATGEKSSKGAKPRAAKKAQSYALHDVQVADTSALVKGESPRFASLEGPETLSECGAPLGYGWYRITLKGSGRKFCHIPHAGDRLHLFRDGARQHVFGVGPGADPEPFELKLGGDTTLIALVDNLGRYSEGNDLGKCKGIYGHVFEVKLLKSVKPKVQEAKPASPFALRGFISGLDAALPSDITQLVWTFQHTRKTPILIDIIGARCSGTFVLNDKPVAYYAGRTGGCFDRILLNPEKLEAFKRGKNVLRFAPDVRQMNAVQEMMKTARIYECVAALSDSSDAWAFAKWEPPAVAAYNPFDKSEVRAFKGLPCWYRAKFEVAAEDDMPQGLPFWLDLSSVSKGQAYINGENLGRYFTATGNGRKVGPQTRLYIPTAWIRFGHMNEVTFFDEHGCDPSRVRVVRDVEMVELG